MAYKGWLKNFKTVIVVGLVVGLAAAVISTPLNLIFWGGQTGNVWGDAFYAFLVSNDVPVWLASFGDSVVVDVPDKLATVIVSYLIFKGLPNNFISIFQGQDKIEEL